MSRMYEQEANFGPNIDLPQLTDIVVVNAMRRAQEVSTLLSTHPNVPSHNRDILEAELNDMWPRMDALVSVTGKLHTPPVEVDEDYLEEHGNVIMLGSKTDDGQDFENGLTLVDHDVVCKSQGFEIVQVDDFMQDGASIGSRYAVKLLFIREVQITVGDGSTIDCETECHADLDEAVITFARNSEHHDQYVAYSYFGDFMEQVNKLTIDTETVAQSLMTIKGLEPTYGHFITTAEQQSLQECLQATLAIESETEPYVVVLRPDTLLFDPNGPSDKPNSICKFQKALIRVCGIEVRPKLIIDEISGSTASLREEPNLFEIRVKARLLREHASDDSNVFALRLTDIEELCNVRQMAAELFDQI